MFINGIGTAVPEHVYTQSEIWDAMNRLGLVQALDRRAGRLLQKILCSDEVVAKRHLALPCLEEVREPTASTQHARFAASAPKLATSAARRALEAAESGPGDINAVIIATCTGYLCPGLTSYVAELLGLRGDIIALDLVGLGCGAAIPSLRTAQALLASRAAARVLVVCVEVCSAAFFLDNDPGVLVSACLFGDGAAAVVLTSEAPHHRRRIEWRSCGSLLDPTKREALRFAHSNGMLRNVLTPEVPRLAAKAARAVLDEVLARAGVPASSIHEWLFHPGGRDVLLALREELGLTEHDLRRSTTVLRNFGNLSSPSVLFALDSAVREAAPAGHWWLSAFGAGFGCHGALLVAE